VVAVIAGDVLGKSIGEHFVHVDSDALHDSGSADSGFFLRVAAGGADDSGSGSKV
jgi:hypothetical protein